LLRMYGSLTVTWTLLLQENGAKVVRSKAVILIKLQS